MTYQLMATMAAGLEEATTGARLVVVRSDESSPATETETAEAVVLLLSTRRPFTNPEITPPVPVSVPVLWPVVVAGAGVVALVELAVPIRRLRMKFGCCPPGGIGGG